MYHERFIYLVTQKLAGNISEQESTELQSLLEQPEANAKFQLLLKYWRHKDYNANPDVEKALAKTMAVINNEDNSVYRHSRYFARFSGYKLSSIILSIILIITVAGFVIFSSRVNTKNNISRYETARKDNLVEKQNSKGVRSLITLADGSNVWLNADSKLKYPIAFTGNTREVELAGEAFFDVTKNKQKPFIIHMQNGTVKVLGTSFNIRAYEGDKVVETSVTTGRVAFIPRSTPKKPIPDTSFITPDFKTVYAINTGKIKIISTNSEEDKAWTKGKLIFKSASIEEIAKVLERTFGKEVNINDDIIYTYHLTGSFENNTLEEILYYLSKTKPFTYRITETQIIIGLIR